MTEAKGRFAPEILAVPAWSAGQPYEIGDVVRSGQHLYVRQVAGISLGVLDPTETSNWRTFVPSSEVTFLSLATVAAAVPTSPTLAEIAAATTLRDVVVTYTGTNTSTDTPTHVFYIDSSGDAVLLRSPNTLTWEFTTNGITTLPGHSYIVAGAHAINLPASPTDGMAVRFSSPVEWSTRGATFTAAGAATVGSGQSGMVVGYDVIEMVYDAASTNWIVHVGGESAQQMGGASGTVNGAAGSAPAPVSGQQDLVLHGDGAWRQIAPAWAASTAYSAGAFVEQSGVLYKRTAAGTSGATFNATEQAAWLQLGSPAKARVFLSETAVNPAGAAPTLSEITTAAGTNRDTILIYTGTDTATDTPTRVYHIDAAGTVTLLSRDIENPLTFHGGFDAASGAFPAAGGAQTGWFYVLTNGGTIDGITFQPGDSLYAVVDGASSTTYANNWIRIPAASGLPYTDDFAAADWALASGTRTLSYTAATHTQDDKPFVQVFQTSGANFELVDVQVTVNAAGDVTISAPDGQHFAGRVMISAGLGGGASGGGATVTTNTLALTQGGGLVSTVNGVAATVAVPAGTIVESIGFDSTGAPVRAADAVINDQAASGYLDLGTMRIQWGTSTNNGTQTNFPVPFANTNYSIVITPASIATVEHRVDTRAANGYTATFFTSGGGGSGGAASQHHYVAIGQKP